MRTAWAFRSTAAREFGRTLLEGAVGSASSTARPNAPFRGSAEVARGEFDARYASLFLRGSTEIERDGYLIRPEAAFELLVVNRDNYTEDGSSAAMSYDGDTSTLATVRLGATVARRFELGSSEGAVELLGRINYREALDDERFKTSYVAGGDRSRRDGATRSKVSPPNSVSGSVSRRSPA